MQQTTAVESAPNQIAAKCSECNKTNWFVWCDTNVHYALKRYSQNSIAVTVVRFSFRKLKWEKDKQRNAKSEREGHGECHCCAQLAAVNTTSRRLTNEMHSMQSLKRVNTPLTAHECASDVNINKTACIRIGNDAGCWEIRRRASATAYAMPTTCKLRKLYFFFRRDCAVIWTTANVCFNYATIRHKTHHIFLSRFVPLHAIVSCVYKLLPIPTAFTAIENRRYELSTSHSTFFFFIRFSCPEEGEAYHKTGMHNVESNNGARSSSDKNKTSRPSAVSRPNVNKN